MPFKPEEREFALNHLNRTAAAFLETIAGLTEAQWNFKPAPDRWSVGECAEHVAITEAALLRLIERALGTSAPGDPAAALTDAQVLGAYANRNFKATAPERIRPAGKPATHKSAAKAFQRNRERTLEWLEGIQADLHAHRFPHPALGAELDAYQWLLVMGAHPERHAAQIREVMAHPDFPR